MTIEKPKTSKAINILLWLAQLLLAFILIWSGIMKIFLPSELPFPWVHENPRLAFVTGIIDLLGGIGLVLPSLLRIKPILTVYAAYGVVALMVSASVFHIMRGEGANIGFNIFLLIAALFIAWGRQKKAPIQPKTKTKEI